MKMTFYFLILYNSLIITKIFAFHCGADQFNHIEPHKVDLPEGTRNLQDEYKPIKIKMDYTYLESQQSSTDLTDRLKTILDKTVSDIESLLSVQHSNFLYQPSYISKFCGIPKFSDDYLSWGNIYDLVIIPYFNDSLVSSSILAAATACVAITDTLQPKMGIIMINPKLEFSKQNTDKFLELLFLHEMSHVLIFHPSFFLFLDMLSQKVINREMVYYIKSPKVVEKARLHFNCDTIDGIPLETYGGAGSSGSHWESRYMLGDYMIATDYPEIVISDISLAVFEDSGYYKVNYYTGGLFRFGKGEGCDFFNKKCIIDGGTPFANEFCLNSQEPFCTSGHLSKGHCYIAKYNSELEDNYQYFSDTKIGGYPPADYCPISFDNLYDKANYYFVTNCKLGKTNTIHSDYGEIFGENSICVESSLIPTSSSQSQIFRSICYESLCDKINKNVILKIAGDEVVCPQKGGLINDPDGFKGKVVCPDYNSVCTSENWCNDPIDCIEKKIIADESSYVYSYILPSKSKGSYLSSLRVIASTLILLFCFYF
jgi:hypothetical protein